MPRERWINHPTYAAEASRKIEQLVRARQIGFTVPETLLTQDEAEAKRFIGGHQNVVVKPLSGGYVERSSAALSSPGC